MENFSLNKKKMIRDLPYQIILYILKDFYEFDVSYKTKLIDFYGKFNKDHCGKIFLIFKTLFIISSKYSVDYKNVPISILKLKFNGYTRCVPLKFYNSLTSIQSIENILTLDYYKDKDELNCLTHKHLKCLSLANMDSINIKTIFSDPSRFKHLDKLKMLFGYMWKPDRSIRKSNTETQIDCNFLIYPKLKILHLDNIHFVLGDKGHPVLRTLILKDVYISEDNLKSIYLSPNLNVMIIEFCTIEGNVSRLVNLKKWTLLTIFECEHSISYVTLKTIIVLNGKKSL